MNTGSYNVRAETGLEEVKRLTLLAQDKKTSEAHRILISKELNMLMSSGSVEASDLGEQKKYGIRQSGPTSDEAQLMTQAASHIPPILQNGSMPSVGNARVIYVLRHMYGMLSDYGKKNKKNSFDLGVNLPIADSINTHGFVDAKGTIYLPQNSQYAQYLGHLPNVMDNVVWAGRSELYPKGLSAAVHQQKYNFNTQYEVVYKDTVSTAAYCIDELREQAKHVAVLNFANAIRPCYAQEGSLRMAIPGLTSSLLDTGYKTVKGRGGQYVDTYKTYLDSNDDTMLHDKESAAGIFTPDVWMIDANTRRVMPHLGGVITSAAVNKGGFPNITRQQYENRIKNQMRFQLRVAKAHDITCVVLGAFGCGEFKNNPQDIVKFYWDVLQEDEFHNQFKRIVFGIVGYDNLNAFNEFINSKKVS